MTDHTVRESLARRICAERGGDWDARRHKRGHWLREADLILEAVMPDSLWSRLCRVFAKERP
jgi:hypothetical protein